MSEDQLFAVGITIAGMILALACMGLAVTKAHERVARLESRLSRLAEDASLAHFDGNGGVARMPAGEAIRRLMTHLGVRLERTPASVAFVSNDEAPWRAIKPVKKASR